jgi:tetratricopeptide (TPR) repeat protein
VLKQLRLPAPPAACPNNLPRSGAVKFVGRETELADLHTQLHQSDRLAITAIQGMGGIGKTELALQYAQYHRDQGTYPGGICWLQAKDQDIGTEIVNFATDQLKLAVPTDVDLARQVQMCWSQWPLAGDVLVVIDDVSGPNDIAAYQAIQPYLPPQATCFWVLLTTRLQLGASIQSFGIEVLGEGAALELLTSLIGAERVNEELNTAKALCNWLGYLPLGLELVGRFLQRRRTWTLAKVQVRLEQKSLAAKALCDARPDMTAAHESLAAAFELSWQDLEESVQELAYRLCLYALAPIPWAWIEKWYPDTDPDELEDWREEGLINRSLLTRVDGETVQLHQLIREFFRGKLEAWPEADTLKESYTQAMVVLAQEISSTPTRDQIVAVTPAMPHIAEAATTWQPWLEDKVLTWPFVGLGRFYEGQGAYGQAEPWRQQCVTVARHRLGDDHPDVAISLNNLAALYDLQGRYGEAEPLYQQALALRQQLLGDEHPDVASSLNNLAALYKSQGRYGEAEPLYQTALALRQRRLGDEHADVAQSLNNLALLYHSQGRYGEAEPLYQKTLAMSKALLGETHPKIATSLNNLALLYKYQGRYGEAEPLYHEALAMHKAFFGETHPKVATNLNTLAALYRAQGRYSEAEPLFQEALTMRKALLGETHPDVAISLNNLAGLYISQGLYQQAEPLMLRALEILIQRLGTEHQFTRSVQQDLFILRIFPASFGALRLVNNILLAVKSFLSKRLYR